MRRETAKFDDLAYTPLKEIAVIEPQVLVFPYFIFQKLVNLKLPTVISKAPVTRICFQIVPFSFEMFAFA